MIGTCTRCRARSWVDKIEGGSPGQAYWCRDCQEEVLGP